MKRAFDIVASLAGLVVFLPLFLIVVIAIKLDSPGPIFFKQLRMGKGFRPFFIYKFRTMVSDAADRGMAITAGNDSRITRVGHFLRQTKLDEIPQLFNVLKGDMAFIGPRPEVPRYVNLFRRDYEEILKVRPGITDIASIKYRDEAALLGISADPEREYVTRVLPDKINLGKEYIRRSSFGFDVALIFKTVRSLFERAS